VAISARSNTFVSLSSSTITDRTGNPVVAIAANNGQQVAQFISDTIKPSLVAFNLNMTSQVLTLTFTEVVRVSTFDPTRFSLQNANVGATQRHTLSTSVHMLSVNDYIIQVGLPSLSDADLIKNQPLLCKSSDSCFIAIDTRAIADMNNNTLVVVPSASPMQAMFVAQDVIAPTLLRFALNMSSRRITLLFDEPVIASSVDLGKLSIQDGGSQYVQLTNGTSVTASVCSTVNGTTLIISLSDHDFFAISRVYGLAKSQATSFIHLDLGFVLDINVNMNEPVTQSCAEYSLDVLPPQFSTWTMNLSTGFTTILFSETVDALTFEYNNLFLLAGTQSALHLTSGLSSTSDLKLERDDKGTSVSFVIWENDLNWFKRSISANVAAGAASAILNGTGQFIADMSGNRVTSFARQIATLYTDIVPPSLRAFDLNLDSQIVVLSFSEPIDLNSILLNKIAISNTQGEMRFLSNSSVVAHNLLQTEFTVRLGLDDFSQLQLFNIAVNSSLAELFLQ